MSSPPRRTTSSSRKTAAPPPTPFKRPTRPLLPAERKASQYAQLYPAEESKMVFKNLDTLSKRRIGSGGASEVYALQEPIEGQRIAIKKYKENMRPLASEIETWSHITKKCGLPKHILPLYGAWNDDDNIRHYSMPLCDFSLEHFLADEKTTEAEKGKKLFFLLPNILFALSCLHEQNIVYRDIQEANVLWCGDNQWVLSDFGISSFYKPKMSDYEGDLRFLAPEVFTTGYVFASDIWGLGTLVQNIFNLINFPTPEIQKIQYKVIRDMTNRDPSKRPTADQALEKIMM